MRSSALPRLLFVAAVLGSQAGAASAQDVISVAADATVAGPAARALGDLEAALSARGLEPRRDAVKASRRLIVGTAASPAVARLLEAQRIALPEAADSLCIRKLPDTLLLAGRDERGLSYALLEAARAVELADRGDPLAAVPEALEAPYLPVRGMTVHLFNADLESEWYFDERYWRGYFRMLARNRYTNLTLTFSDQTNYLTPLYAYLVDVPAYPQVRVKGLTPQQRRRNLAMLKRIAELAAERGLDFTLGIWMQAPVPAYSAQVLVEQLPQGLEFADYCAQGLRQVLEACPAITRVQFRMNAEAGVSEEMQTEFFAIIFRAMAACGRPIKLELRFKGLRPATIAAARAAGLDVTVSIKFWCEHLGLPYHPTVAEKRYRQSRYSYGTLLTRPRDYRLLCQLWSVGSQRLLLWGDPDYAARFARSCRLIDSDGFEVFAPLTNKGYGNQPGRWRIFADRDHEVGTWDHERYWFFYLAFGRLGYTPQADPEVWRRELRQRFGAAAEHVEGAYRAASQIMPLVTAARLPSAGEWRWWPEMDTGGRLPEYMRTQPSDTAQFYAIRSWQRTRDWHWEDWDDTIRGYVDDAVAGRLRARTTPLEVAQKLERRAEETKRHLAHIEQQAPVTPELRGTLLDLRVLAELGRYHAEKTHAATHLAFFERTGARGRLPEALTHMRAAAAAWKSVVRLTDKVYHDNLVFGIPQGSPQMRGGRHHGGHWRDRLPEVEADVVYLEELLKEHGGSGQKFPAYPGETIRSLDVQLDHEPVRSVPANTDLPLSAHVRGPELREVILHYRPLDQTRDWKEVPMQRRDGDRWHATIPAADIPARWDLQYYFEALVAGGGGRLFPSWERGTPYIIAKVER